MKLLVIGHSVEDHIIKSGGDEVKPGGIFYTASLLNVFKEADDQITLLTTVEKENYKLFSSIYDNFDKNFLQIVDSIPKVFLKIHNNEERDECYNKVTGNIDTNNIQNLNSFDGILINMITGFDIKAEQLEELRRSYNGLIYFDVHTLSRGLEEGGKRNFRIIPDFNKWAVNLDFIQVNEKELLTLSSKSDRLEIAKEILSTGVKYLILTMENLGARIYFLNNGELNSIFKSALKIQVRNKIGCGDIFGAAFFYSYLADKDINKSLQLANIAAGLIASYDNLLEMKNLKKDVFARYY